MKTLSSFKGSPPKRGIGICLIVMFAMMVSFSSSTFAAAAPDVPDVTKTAVQESPGSSVEFQLIVNDVAKARSTFDGQQLMAKSAAANQNPVNSQDLYSAAEKEESIDLQALVPPLISVKEEMNGNVHKIGSQAANLLIEITKPSATMEVSAEYDIADLTRSSLNGANTAEAKPAVQSMREPAVQLKRPIVAINATANNDSYEKESVRTAAYANANLSQGVKTVFT